MRNRLWPSCQCHLFVLSFLVLAGCGRNASTGLPKKHIRYLVEAAVPAYVHVDGCRLEAFDTKNNPVVNFKVVVVPKEPLYLVENVTDGVPKVTLIKVVHEAKEKVPLYGSVHVQQRNGKWILSPPIFQQDYQKLGYPISAFDTRSYVIGSPEATAALERQSNYEQMTQVAMEKHALYKEAEVKCIQRVKEEYLSRIQNERRNQEVAVKAVIGAKEMQNLRERQMQMRTKLLDAARNETIQRKAEEPLIGR